MVLNGAQRRGEWFDGPVRDVFISHAGEDKDHIARPLRDALVERGWSVWLDEAELDVGDSLYRQINEGLVHSRFGAVIISPSFLAKNWPQHELAGFAAREDASGDKVILPVWHQLGLQEVAARLPTLADRVAARSEEGIGVVADRLSRAMGRAGYRTTGASGTMPAAGRLPTIEELGAPPVHFNIPLGNPHFVGRGPELAELKALFEADSASPIVTSIHGMGGVGKSQLAARYVHEALDDYRLIAWIRVDDGGLPDLAQLAETLGEPVAGRLVSERAAMAVRRLAATQARWLLVLDNVSALDQVPSCLPTSGRGHVLITTRLTDVAEVGTVIRGQVFDPGTAVSYLLTRSRRPQDDAASEVARALGYLPLALSHAGAYCASGTSFSEYLQMLDELPSEALFSANRELWYQLTVATTWQVSIAEAAKHHGRSPLALAIAAHLGPEAIPRQIFEIMEKDASPTRRRKTVGDVLDVLARLSLVEVEANGVSVHRLLQKTIRDEHADRHDERPALLALEALLGVFPAEAGPERWFECQSLVPHVLAVAKAIPDGHPTAGEPMVQLLNRVGEVLNRAERGRALSYAKTALIHAERLLPEWHIERLAARERVATAHFWRDEWETALELELGILRDRTRLLGPDHLLTLEAEANVADTRRIKGEPELAIPIQERVIAKREELLEAEDLTDRERVHLQKMVLTARNTLACSFREVGRIDEAVTLLHRVIRERARLLGEFDADTIVARANLASCHLAAGDVQTAVALYRDVLDQRERVLPDTHPDTDDTRESFARALRWTWETDAARQVLEKLVTVRTSALGPADPETRVAQQHLDEVNAGILIREAEAADAEALAAIKHAREDELYADYGTLEEHREGLRQYCSAEYIEHLRQDADTTLLVAETREGIVGLGAISRRPDRAWIHALCARSSGGGIGSAVLRALFSVAEQWGYDTIGCEVFERNERSRRYFERLDFVESGIRQSETYQGQMLRQYARMLTSWSTSRLLRPSGRAS